MTRTQVSNRRSATRWKLGVAMIAGASVLSACAVSSPGDGGSAPAVSRSAEPNPALVPSDIRSKGSVTVAIDPTYPPFETLSADQRSIQGLDPDLLAEIGRVLGLKIQYAQTQFDSIIPGLAAGRYDLAISGMTDTAVREKQVNFVDYFNAGGALVTRAGGAITTGTMHQALCGKTVGVQLGTITVALSKSVSQTCTAAGKPSINLQMFPSVPAAVLAMSSGRIDYVWTDSVSAATQVLNGKGRFAAVNDGTAPAHTGIAFPKSSNGLAQAFRTAVQILIKNGSYAAVLKKYGLSSGGVSSVTMNDAGGY